MGEGAMPTASATELAARLDRLPMTRHLWVLVALISLGGAFELYDLFLTAYIAPGLLRAGFFEPESLGPLRVLTPYGIGGIGTFVFALFAGLFVGAIVLGHFADRFGRRGVFTFSLIWYSITTAIMAFQTSGFGVDFWRFIAGIGIGIELVTIDTYVSELVPRSHRGRAYAFNQFFQFLAVPIVAFLAWLLIPRTPLGLAGWRWVVLIGSLGAIVVWFIRLSLPESPRWLARQGRLGDAEAVVERIERRVAADARAALPSPGIPVSSEAGAGRFAEIWRPPYNKRTIMLSVFNFFQTFGYYGFAAWVPTLLIAKGIKITTSLEYSFIIAIANPVGPLLCTLFADRIERKWQVCLGAIGIGIFGMLFARSTLPAALIALGVAVTLCNNLMSYSFHNYQSELFPTRIRSRAIGFVYSWSRLSAAFSGLIVAHLLHLGGVDAVFAFIAFAMALVVVTIGGFGPRTRGLALEAIAH
jgi:MFS transporter, putative metabolite:H+ symporter